MNTFVGQDSLYTPQPLCIPFEAEGPFPRT